MIDQAARQRIADNWNSVVEEVHGAASDCGRDPSSVHVIGVSKYVDAELTSALVAAGCHQLGESRPQLLWQKAEEMEAAESIEWHMIGHLQRNKVRRLLRYRPLVHSIDSERILRAIADEASQQGQEIDVLLEVNISGDESKTGLTSAQLVAVLESLPEAGVVVRGLMAMAGWGTDRADAKRHFEQTRDLRDRVQDSTGVQLPELSMGMSGDFREAIEAGATMVRIGSRLFEGLIDRS
ncbi:MAG: YggS family pyridoxal phosphate-dependent enzyme [Rubripirellula sp.]